MSVCKCPQRDAGYLKTEMRLFTFLTYSLNNSGEGSCRKMQDLTGKDVFKEKPSPENSQVLHAKGLDALNELVDLVH